MKRLRVVLISSCLLLPMLGCSSTTERANEQAEEVAEAKGGASLIRVDNPDEDAKFLHASVIRSTNQTYMPTKSVVCISYTGDTPPNVRSGVEVEVANPGKKNFMVTLKLIDPDKGCAEYHDKGVPRYEWKEAD